MPMANSLLAAILSFFIPGLGQFYCGHFLRGLFVFIMFSILAFFLGWTLIIPFLFWIWNLYDAITLADRKSVV